MGFAEENDCVGALWCGIVSMAYHAGTAVISVVRLFGVTVELVEKLPKNDA